LTYKRFDYFSEDIEVKDYKEMIQKLYVKPYFEEFIDSQPHIIALKNNIEYTKLVLKTYLHGIKLYFYKQYPKVYDLIHLIIKSSGYESMYSKIKKLASTKLDTKIDDIGFSMLAKKGNYTCLNSTQLLYIEKTVLPKYQLFVDNLYNNMERTYIESILNHKNAGTEFDVSSYVLSQSEIDILCELRKIIVIYINCYKYYVRIISSC
jgi:hypothetical protein